MFLQNDDGFLFPHCYHYFRFRCYSVEVNFFGLVALVDYFQRTMIGEDYLTIFDFVFHEEVALGVEAVPPFYVEAVEVET